MNLALEIFLRILAAAYLGACVWFTIRILIKAGHAWWWAAIAWSFGIFVLVPNLEWIAVFGQLILLVLVWLFAFFEWPVLVDTTSVGRRSRGVSEAEAEASAKPGPAETQLLGSGPATPRGGGPAPRDELTTWLLAGFDDAGHTVRLEVTDKELDEAGDEGVIVGRNPQMARLVLSDDSVSRRHARLRRKGGMLVVEDLDSANGTIVNGERLVANRGFACKRGATIQFGGVTLTLSRG